jgi:amylosucrase
MYHGLKHLIETRVNTPHLHAAVETHVLETQNSHVFVYDRAHALGSFIGVYNFSETAQTYPVWQLQECGIFEAFDRISKTKLEIMDGVIWLAPYARLWIIQA